MRKALLAFLALSLSCVSVFSQCLIPKASGDTVFPVTGNYYTDSSNGTYYSQPSQIYNIARTGNQYYVLGTFTHIGPNQGPGVIVDSATHNVVSSKTWRPNGFVRASVPDGHGGFFIAGDFTMIGTAPRTYLAQIDANGKPTAWAPQVNAPIYTLYARNDTLFTGGRFTACGGQTRSLVAAWSTSGDTLLPVRFPMDTTGSISFIKPCGPDKLFFAGSNFPSSPIMQFDLHSQQYTLWSPPFSGGGPSVGAMEVSGDGSTVYYTDTYTNLVYADDAITGKQKFRISLTYYNSNTNEVQTLALKTVGNTLYIGGLFFKVTDAMGASYFQNGICAVDASTGVLKNFNPQLNNSEVNYLDAHGNDLIIGGLFSKVGDSTRQYLALVDTGTYALDSWHPLPSDGVLTVSYSGGRIFVGGVFDGLQSVPRNGLAGFDATTGEILPFNPPLPTIYGGKKMVIRGDTLFALVRTDDLDATVEQDRLLLYNLSTGAQLSSPTDNWPSLADYIFDGGYMYTSSGTYIRRYVLPGLGLDGGWLANFDLPEASEPQTLCQDSTSIYTVGDNRTAAGNEFPAVPYLRFSRIDKANPANITSYEYVDTINQQINPRPQFNHAVLSDSLLFVQGFFNSLNGTVARSLAAINIHTGKVLNYSPAYYGPNAAPYNYNQPFLAVTKFQPMNGGIWYGYNPISPLTSFTFPLSFGAIDSATGIFLPPPFTLDAGPFNNGSLGADAVSGQIIWNAVDDFLLDPDQPVLVGSFGEINGQPSRCIVRLTYGTYSPPSVAQTIAGPDTAVAGSDSVQYSLADTLGYNWTYSGSNVTVVNNGQDPVFLSFAANATGGTLSATGKGYCNSTVSSTPKNIVVIRVTPAPKVNGCCMLFKNTQTTQTSLSFSPGNGTGRLVVASTSPITSLPVLGTAYNADATFGSGSDLGGGNFVVYAGAGDSLTVTGLRNSTKYYFAVFEYAVSNDTIKYQLQQPYSDSMTTLSPVPTLAPSNILFSHVGTTSLTISCTAGNGNGRIFLLKAADSIQALPQEGIAYRANTLFLYGSAFADGSYVVANTGTGVNVTGLSPGTTYYVKIFEYAGTGGATDYLTSAWAADTVTTAIAPPPPPPPSAPTVNASAITVTNITTSSATATCVPGNGQNRLFAIRAQGTIIDTPLSNHAYPASPIFGAGGNIGDSTFVLAASGTSVAITGLSAGTIYSVAVFEYNGSGDSTVYMGHSFPSVAFTTTAATPPTQPTVNWQDSGFSVKAYPNPTHGSSLMQITSSETGTITFRIVAFGGNQLEGFSFAIVPGINAFPLPYLAGLPRGIYILYWQTNDQKGTVSIIKL